MATFLKNLKRIVKRLVFFWKRLGYAYSPEHTVIADYAEFSGLNVREVERRINSYKLLTKREWEKAPGTDFAEKASTFYGASSYYICDILAANVSPAALTQKLDGFSTRLLKSLWGHSGKRLLEFGGGTGVFCEIAVQAGKDVTYLDIPGVQYDFAEWRFAKYGLPVRMLQTRPGFLKLEGFYDLIFTDAVIEHLEDPYTPAAELAAHLSDGGVFLMLVDLAGEEADMPMHKNVDIVALHRVLSDAGLVNDYGLHEFASIWRRS